MGRTLILSLCLSACDGPLPVKRSDEGVIQHQTQPRRIPYEVSGPVLNEVMRLQRGGHPVEARAHLLTLVGDPDALWEVTEPNRDPGTYFNGGRQYTSLLLAEGRIDEASAYVARKRRLDDAGDRKAYPYDAMLSEAEVRQLEGLWDEARTIYDQIGRDMPRTGYGTEGHWFAMWNSEVLLGKAEVWLAEGEVAYANAFLDQIRVQDLEKLRIRFDDARARANAVDAE